MAVFLGNDTEFSLWQQALKLHLLAVAWEAMQVEDETERC